MALNRVKTRANAQKFIRANRLQDAIRELQKLAEDNPRDIQTLNQIGNLHLRLGDKESAVPLFLKVAELYNKNGFATKAVASLKIAAREAPDNLGAWQMLASLSEQQGFAREARLAFEKVAQLIEGSGNIQGLVQVQNKIVELEPGNIKVRIQLGDSLIKLDQTQKAVKQYLKAADQMVAQGLLKEAAKLFERALQLGPENLRSLESLVKDLLAKKQGEQALGILDELLAGHPKSESLLLLKIESLAECGKADEAVATCQNLLEVNPSSAPAMAKLVRLLMEQKKVGDACAYLSSWAEKGEEGRLPEIEALLQEVLHFHPGNVQALQGLCWVYRRKENQADLVQTLESLAKTAQGKDRRELAAEALQELAQLNPGDRDIAERISALEEKEAPKEQAEDYGNETGELEIEIEASDLSLASEEETASLEAREMSSIQAEKEGEEESAPALTPPEEKEQEGAPIPAMDAHDAQQIREQLTEAEVFLKYGFADKAVTELQAVLKKVPDHIHAHQKLIAIFKKQNKKKKVVKQIIKLAQIFKDQGDMVTCQNLVEEAKEIDPNAKAIQEFEEPTGSLEIVVEEGAGTGVHAPPGKSKGKGGLPELDLGLLIPLQEEAAAPEQAVEMGLEEKPNEPPKKEVAPEAPREEEEIVLTVEADEEEQLPSESELSERLEEVEFYVSQELYGEATRTLEALEEKWADDGRIKALRKKLSAAVAKEKEVAEKAAEGPVAAREGEVIEEKETESAKQLFEDTADLFDGEEVEEEGLSLEEAPEEKEKAKGVEDTSPLAHPEEETEEPAPNEEARPSRTKMKVTLSELLPDDVLDQDKETFQAEDAKEEYFDLASELGAALDGLQTEEGDLFEGEKSPEEMSFEEVFEEFKKGVEKKVGEEDFATHYNLGIAYKEMELLDEAIGEFQVAARSPQYFVECCSMLGLCFRQKEMPELAEKWYRKGVEAPGFSDDAYIGLKYDLAETLELQDRKEEALELFKEVFAVNANYREVKAKMGKS